MFDNAQLDKMIIFALIGIVAILVVAVFVLAVKRNIYYVDENGNEIKPNKKQLPMDSLSIQLRRR
jgi:cell division protein FtsL